MNIIDKRASNPAAALDGTELVYVAQLGADAVTTVQDIQYFATNGFLLITTAASTYVAKNAPITGATKTKITYNTDGLITSGADATTADIADSPNRRYITDAQQTVLNNTSNTNSGDETTATIKTKLGAASSTADGYLTSTDWTTFNGKQEPLADVITANTYGSSTQYPIVTVNAKGIVTGVTLQTVPLPTFTDATFSVQKAGSPSIAASWDLTALTASYVHTYPNKAIDFGDLPSVATTNSNSTSTGARLLKGDNCTLVNNSPCVVNGSSIASNFVTGGAGYARGGAAGSASNYLRPAYVNVPLAVFTTTGATSDAWAIDGGTTYPMAVAPQENAGTYYLAIHRVTFSIIISGTLDAYGWVGVRRIVCRRDPISGGLSIVSVTTEGTDYVHPSISGQSISVTLGAVVTPSTETTHAPLLITATSTTSGASSILCQATLESYYANIG